ncbi:MULTISPECIES: enoyl-CoA hydratase/isomerase family protein [Mycobacterium avium complex (MAC)]|uniref:enoyl-CoA hydratase/isomerase family protein n=1 Tax=Mycobacterium avium complex (MAC) TaxID=120793 RepID=UPI0004BB2968|nr:MULTISPECIES: enoyl-CoA hydratase/isomerase family protein [Mycobacterium avium complex (MAC)]MCA2272021.1 enoyl-CoA hydratase/isomerase family protein [Mycobacterium intracellulare]MCA2323690.1 enoyl-CoA hydratase/isomerase family protein [Mycobacterium intracellulare]UEB23331.1 enoyl-CoA hydratase/isomerase family protein [Mycobacterium intracellulare]BCO61850.1 enoyl-CoA hydratase [Mycobacterium intracellulare]BCO72610.1 enoyl-CoA hydratase [Mycobacterium intracellulare]
MTASSTSDDRVLFDIDHDRRIATVTLNNPQQRNSYDASMREAVARCLDRVADDDDLTVVLLRGAEGVFSTGADMNNAYGWYGDKAKASDDAAAKRRPSQRRRLAVDRKSFGFYHNFMGFPKVTVGEIAGYALGGGFEMALMTDISVIARDTKVGMPATRFLGPALGSLHMFFHRLGPVLARRLLLTGDIIEAGAIEHLGIFTDTCDPGAVTARARYWAEKAAKMPADGVVIAKEAFRLVEQSQAYQGEEVASYLFHAFGTNLQFGPAEFNFVKTRAQHGAREAFRLRDEHFHVPEPEA